MLDIWKWNIKSKSRRYAVNKYPFWCELTRWTDLAVQILHSPINSKNCPPAFSAPPCQILLSQWGQKKLLPIATATGLCNCWSITYTCHDREETLSQTQAAAISK